MMLERQKSGFFHILDPLNEWSLLKTITVGQLAVLAATSDCFKL